MAALTPEDLQKLKRRHKRDLRFAEAKGLLLGVAAMLRPGDLAIDCGANQGDITELLAATGAVVHAFEPDPYNYDKLAVRFSDHANVHLHAAAVGATAGTVRLMRASNWADNPRLASVKSTVIGGGRSISTDDAIDVEMIDLPVFLQGLIRTHGRIAFVKMDIEGAELDLLDAMLDVRLFDAIQFTVAETHERKFKDLRPQFAALRARIAEAYPPTRVNLDWV